VSQAATAHAMCHGEDTGDPFKLNVCSSLDIIPTMVENTKKKMTPTSRKLLKLADPAVPLPPLVLWNPSSCQSKTCYNVQPLFRAASHYTDMQISQRQTRVTRADQQAQ